VVSHPIADAQVFQGDPITGPHGRGTPLVQPITPLMSRVHWLALDGSQCFATVLAL
jgi:hypothetical protein